MLIVIRRRHNSWFEQVIYPVGSIDHLTQDNNVRVAWGVSSLISQLFPLLISLLFELYKYLFTTKGKTKKVWLNLIRRKFNLYMPYLLRKPLLLKTVNIMFQTNSHCIINAVRSTYRQSMVCYNRKMHQVNLTNTIVVQFYTGINYRMGLAVSFNPIAYIMF